MALALVLLGLCLAVSHAALDPLNITQLIQAQGFACEQHDVVTADGFILSVQRIPRPGAPVAFLQHGLEDSAVTWAVNLRNESLAFILADAGFDVWLGNSRGNIYSDRHITYNMKQPEFWDWSMDQMAAYDVPAMIDHALNVTQRPNLAWIGHSQGTMQMFFALSGNNTIKSKLNLFVALAPVAYCHHLTSPLLKILADVYADKLIQLLGVTSFFFNDTQWLTHHFPEICPICPICCSDIVEAIMGDLNRANLNMSRLETYLDVVHFAQLVRKNVVQKYDYGSHKENLKHYGQTTPPTIKLSLAGVPTALFSGGKDTLADPKDVAQLKQALANTTVVYEQFTPGYTHMDYVWGLDCGYGIYKDITALLRNYSSA